MPAPAGPPASRIVNRRAEAKQETRTRLIAAARDAFAAEGIDGPSLDAICERAGFTRGAFYVHFKSRDELVEAVVDSSLREFVDALLAGSEETGGLAGSIRRFADLAARLWSDVDAPPPTMHHRFDTLVAAAHRNPRIAATLREALVAARSRLETSVEVAKRSGPATQPDAREVANLLLLLALGVLTAADLGLPMNVAQTRDALLALLDAEEPHGA